MDTYRHIKAWSVFFVLQAVSAYAAVQSIDATVVAEVKQFVDGQELNSDYAFEDLDETTGNLPLIVVAELPGEEGQAEDAGAVASTYFYDPRLSTTPDPDEFGLDVAVFSLLDNVFYQGRGQATETREITFTESEIGKAAGTALEVRSYFFLDGYMVVWTDTGHVDLTGTTAEVMLSVEQIRGEQSEKVLEARLLLEGQADGSVLLTAEGALSVENVVLMDMTTEEVSELGRIHTVVIPNLAIPYFYEAKVDETFVLKADISARANGRPMTGASVALGFPLQILTELFYQVTGENSTGEQLQGSLNEVVDNAPLPAKPLKADGDGEIRIIGASPTAGLLSPLCGAMAVELAGLLVGLTLMRVIPGGRRKAGLTCSATAGSDGR